MIITLVTLGSFGIAILTVFIVSRLSIRYDSKALIKNRKRCAANIMIVRKFIRDSAYSGDVLKSSISLMCMDIRQTVNDIKTLAQLMNIVEILFKRIDDKEKLRTK
jgi:hypothetical protein